MEPSASTRKRKRKTPSQRKRGCKCIVHNQVCDGRIPDRIYTIANPGYDKASLEQLIKMKVMSARSKYVCSLCIEQGTKYRLNEKHEHLDTHLHHHVDQDAGSSSDSLSEAENAENMSDDKESDRITDLIDELMARLKTASRENIIVNTKIDELLSFIGRTILRPSLQADVEGIRNQYLQIDALTNVDLSHMFLQKCNKMLINFIASVSDRNVGTMDDTMIFRFCVCIESIYHLKNSNLVLPHSFLANIIQTTTSGSKTVTEINAKILPSGSDTTYRSWLQLHGIDELLTPDGDIDVYFDNIGKYIEKSYRVNADRKRTPTVISAVLNIPLKSTNGLPSPLQNNPEYKPSTWSAVENEKYVQKKMEQIISDSETNFRRYRFQYIAEIMDYMDKSNEMDDQISNLTRSLEKSQYTRICNECGDLHLPRKQKCSCGGKVVAIQTSSANPHSFHNKFPKYLHIGEILNFNPSDTSLNEPIMLNPNSFENIKAILDILKVALIDSSNGRKWTFIGADGPPYTIMRRIIETDPDKYDWIVLVSGRGHLNMNELKTFFKVIDNVCGELLGKEVLDFNTPKSYSYFINCKDTHKSWQALEIFLHGTSMELIQLYISSLDGTGAKPTPLGFMQWQAAVKSPTLKFVIQLTFTIALSVYVQRIGDRNNDVICSEAGRYKFLNMFYAFNHPIYREVEYNDLRQKALYPDALRKIRNENCTFSNPGSLFQNNHEGGDFKLENKNKCIKAIAPKGQKGEDMWRRVVRCTESVSAVVKNGKCLLKLNKERSSRRTPIESEIAKYRAHLRHKQFLTVDAPFVQSVDGTKLNDALMDFMDVLKEKRVLFWQMVADGTPLQSVRYQNLSILEEDDEIGCFSGSDDDSDYGWDA